MISKKQAEELWMSILVSNETIEALCLAITDLDEFRSAKQNFVDAQKNLNSKFFKATGWKLKAAKEQGSWDLVKPKKRKKASA